MKIDWNRKYNTIAMYVIIVLAICVVLAIGILRINYLLGVVARIIEILMPIIVGIVIAYLLNPVMSFFERKCFRKMFKKKPRPKLVRALSITTTLLITLLVISAIIAVILPELLRSVVMLGSNLKTYYVNVTKWVTDFTNNNDQLDEIVKQALSEISKYIDRIIDWIQGSVPSMLSKLTSGILGVITGIKNFVLGIIVSVYLLFSKESFLAQGKKVMFAIFPNSFCIRLLRQYQKAHKVFTRSITGVLLDALIVGMICFIGTSILQIPYSILISVLIAVTNIIPFFGPFIGAVPSAFLVFMVDPIKTIWFLIFIIVLQQLDGNILVPRIQGDSTGLPAFWVLFALFLGGGLFGVFGMLVAVPVFAVIYMLVRAIIEKILAKKNMPVETLEYSGPMDKYDVPKSPKGKLPDEPTSMNLN